MRTYSSRRATEHDHVYHLFGPRSYAHTATYVVYHTPQDPYTVIGAARIVVARGDWLPRVYVWSATKAPSAIRSLLTAACRTALSRGHRAIELYSRAGQRNIPCGTYVARGNRMYARVLDSPTAPTLTSSTAPHIAPPLDTARVVSV